MNLPDNDEPRPERGRALANCYAVLIVDDMKANRLLLKQLLRSVGYHTYEVSSGQAALDFLESCVPDAIVTDVEMPEMTGLEMLAAMRAEGGKLAEVPVIAATGNPVPGIEEELYAVGADAFIAKPVDVSELISTVANLIRGGRPKDPQEAAAARRAGVRQHVKVLTGL